MRYQIEISLLLILPNVQSTSLLNWFWSKPDEERTQIGQLPHVAIPYESLTEDEKFLQEASKISDIQLSSPLEICQHKVIMRIKTSCSTMTEEELAKLSVNLLNCQSAVEGRQIFPCTEHMSLKQCTTDMDSDLWNAYHLISNRARAVCYAARSTQFRALTELTVNKLMDSAQAQIQALETLQKSHEELSDETIQALSKLTTGNKILLEQQQYLKDAHSTAQRLVTDNLRELYNEKALIRNGHAQLAMMTEDIRKKLERANDQMSDQATERHENHQQLMEDLVKLQRHTEAIWDKIESSTNRIIELNDIAADNYKKTLENLQEMNATVSFILSVTNSMRSQIEEKLNWITDYIGDTGEQLERIYHISLHIVYLLVAMIIAAFLNTPLLTRVTIMSLIPINLMSFLKHGTKACLDFTSITVLIILISGMHFVMVGIHRFIASRRNKNKYNEFYEEKVKGTEEEEEEEKDEVPRSSTFLIVKKSTTSLIIHLTNTFQNIKEFIYRSILNCKDSFQHLVSQFGGSTCTEELSCSYGPSRKEEAVVDSFYNESSLFSDDDDKSFQKDLNFIRDNLELRNKWSRKSPESNYSYQHSPSRSVSPSSSDKVQCAAMTKSGVKCRSWVSLGRRYCGRHNH